MPFVLDVDVDMVLDNKRRTCDSIVSMASRAVLALDEKFSLPLLSGGETLPSAWDLPGLAANRNPQCLNTNHYILIITPFLKHIFQPILSLHNYTIRLPHQLVYQAYATIKLL